MYILTQCADYKYSDYQFGFISGRGTQTAIALANDVLEYCNYNESAVFVCNLDAEGAYHGIPHPILFMKSMNIIPDMSWKLLYRWYNQINVKIKWNKLGSSIKICKGTHQGGITSTFLFNIFYRELIDILSNHDGGIKICNQRFNIFCYADDILLVSTTKSGLQNLINTAVKYVDDHGLRFNPSKAVCLVKGDNPFVFTPKFYIKNCELKINDSIVFLGATLGNKANNIHVDNRISACRKAFYSLQGAGLCKRVILQKTTYFMSHRFQLTYYII